MLKLFIGAISELAKSIKFYLIIDQTEMIPSVQPKIRSESSSEKTIHFSDL